MFHLFESVKSNEMSYPSYYHSTFASKVNGFFFSISCNQTEIVPVINMFGISSASISNT